MHHCTHCDTATEGYLCQPCTRAVARRLDRMPKLYEALAAFLRPGSRRPEYGSARPVEAPLPVAESVLDLRGPGGIVGVLEDWRAAMQADRGWGPPATTGDIRQRVAAASRGLALNLEWIAAQWPAAGDCARELAALERNVLSVIDPPTPSLRLGTCPAVFEDDEICGAVLRVPNGTAKVECRWCNTVYPPDTWYALATGEWADEDGGPQDAAAA